MKRRKGVGGIETGPTFFTGVYVCACYISYGTVEPAAPVHHRESWRFFYIRARPITLSGSRRVNEPSWCHCFLPVKQILRSGILCLLQKPRHAKQSRLFARFYKQLRASTLWLKDHDKKYAREASGMYCTLDPSATCLQQQNRCPNPERHTLIIWSTPRTHIRQRPDSHC